MFKVRQDVCVNLATLLQPWIKLQYDELCTALSDLGDPENVHVARVRARRLRSVLGGWHLHLPPHAPKLRRRLQELGRSISALRDIDVIHELISLDPPDDLPQWEALLAQQRAPLLASAREVASSSSVHQLLLDLHALAYSNWGSIGRLDVEPIAHEVFDAEQARLSDLEANAIDTHDVRKGAKRLRYNAEVLAPKIAESEAVAIRAEQMQQSMGSSLDSEMVESWLTQARLAQGVR